MNGASNIDMDELWEDMGRGEGDGEVQTFCWRPRAGVSQTHAFILRGLFLSNGFECDTSYLAY